VREADTDRHGLANWLAEQWGEPTDVEIVRYSTAGARRRNVVFDASTPSRQCRLVGTISPNTSVEIMSMSDEVAVRLLARTHGVPVPAVVGSSDDPAMLGGSFFISEFEAGETIPRRVMRLVDRIGHGDRIVGQIGRSLARLHEIDPKLAPASLAAGNYPLTQAFTDVAETVGSLEAPEPVFAYALRWLDGHKPTEPDRLSVVHADVRTGNLIIDETGLRSILDWETSKVGDPMEDLAWICTRMWRFGRDQHVVGGLGSLAELRTSYEGAGGQWDDDRFRWWRILTALRWGTGLALQAMAHLDGSFPSIVMAASGRRVAEMAFDVLAQIESEVTPT
jgi:aminoglycoside phosphotransferase (APT) family kinase protein